MCRVDHPSPPLKWLVAYRLLGVRLPPEYAPWVVEDAATRGFLWWRSLRTFLWLQVFIALAAVGRRIGYGEWIPRVWLYRFVLASLAVVLFSSRDSLVRRTLRWQRIDKRGKPVEKVKPVARMDNREAVLLGLLALVVFTAGAVVYGYGERPTGLAALPCREADPDVLERIEAGKKNPEAKYVTTRMVMANGTAVVLAVTDLGNSPRATPSPTAGASAPASPSPSGSQSPKPVIEGWIVDPAGTITRLGATPDATTSFPATEKPDRGVIPLIERAARCLSQKPVPRP